MACLGYLLALNDAVIGMVEELDMTDAPDHASLDKAWDGWASVFVADQ